MVYRINNPEVIAKEIEGEIIVINLVNGNYYTIEGQGKEVWNLLNKGYTLEELNAYFPQRKELAKFVEQLTNEDLMKAHHEDKQKRRPKASLSRAVQKHDEAVFGFTKYTDMQDFLLVDPIHEVSEEGWPHVKK